MSKQRQKQLIWIIFGVFVFTNFCYPFSSQAATLHTLSDRISRHAPLIGAIHEFKFTTPSGVGESGDYIRISFDGGFDLSPIIFSDVTLSHGAVTGLEITETVSVAPSATNWGLSVAGNHIDLIHPTNSANGDIAPDDVILINIGGTHKIINPAAIGSKVISLAIYNSSNTVIDAGRLAVPIAQDQIGVGGTPSGTLPTPVILNFPYSVTTNSLDLDWSENFDLTFNRYELYMATSAGVTNLNGDLLITVTDRIQTIFNIDGLAPSRTYYFVVYVFDNLGNHAASNEVYATTQNSGGPVWPNPPVQPTINSRICPIFSSNFTIDGTKPSATTIYINGTTENVNYPTDLTWAKLVMLGMGSNLFLIFAQDSYGQKSPMLTATVNRCEVGDTNCSGVIDDFDLAGLAYHWSTNWCYADFNEDGIVDDFDLSGLAAHWDSIY
jgi:hypothetical protein